MTDIELFDEGTLVGFALISAAANDWFGDHVHSEPQQWLGGVLYVDQCLARDLLEGIVNAGLIVDARQ